MRTATPTLREWLREGDFTLAMSSGFFGFYAHAGALDALESAGFTPRACTGSSAGALVAGLRASGLLPDALRGELTRLRREDFWDPSPGAGLLRGRLFRERLEALLPVRAVEDCAIRYSASVYDLRALRTAVLSRGSLAAAIHASCALPGLFHPVWIDGRPFSDGGIADRAGVAGIGGDARVLHHHLASRSPWRRAGAASMRVPVRDGLVSVAIEGVPRLHPFALGRGADAFRQAERGMRDALDRPVTDGVVRLSV